MGRDGCAVPVYLFNLGAMAAGYAAGCSEKLIAMKKDISEEAVLIRDVMAPHRSIAYDAVTDIMLEAFEELSDVLNEKDLSGEEGWTFNRSVCSFRPEQVEKIMEIGKFREPVVWLSSLTEGEKMAMMMAFMDWDRLRMQEFRDKYPRSFTKWEPAEDEALLEMYSRRLPWQAISGHFGRNVNAVKLRLQHLGVDLGAEAGRARYLRRPGSRAAAAAEMGEKEE